MEDLCRRRNVPSHLGTGTEDYYGYAWATEPLRGPFMPSPRRRPPSGQHDVAAHRALDAIPFNRSLKFDMEIWHWRNVLMDYAVVTYYYARPGAKITASPTG